MEFEDHPLWNFTIEAHQRHGVHKACVMLQVHHDIDINVLFWCCWAGAVGAPPLDETQMHQAMDAVGPWQREIVKPIWNARWKLKPAYGSFPKNLTEPLRQQLIKAELNAEHIEMLHLAHAVKIRMIAGVSTRDKAAHAAINLKCYLSRHFALENSKESPAGSQNQIPKNILNPLSIVLWACFPDLTKEDVLTLL